MFADITKTPPVVKNRQIKILEELPMKKIFAIALILALALSLLAACSNSPDGSTSADGGTADNDSVSNSEKTKTGPKSENYECVFGYDGFYWEDEDTGEKIEIAGKDILEEKEYYHRTYAFVAGNWLYFNTSDRYSDLRDVTQKLVRYNLKTKARETFMENVDSFLYSEGWFYVINYENAEYSNCDLNLVKINPSGEKTVLLSNFNQKSIAGEMPVGLSKPPVGTFEINGDTLSIGYFRFVPNNNSENFTFTVKTDGTGKTEDVKS